MRESILQGILAEAIIRLEEIFLAIFARSSQTGTIRRLLERFRQWAKEEYQTAQSQCKKWNVKEKMEMIKNAQAFNSLSSSQYYCIFVYLLNVPHVRVCNWVITCNFFITKLSRNNATNKWSSFVFASRSYIQIPMRFAHSGKMGKRHYACLFKVDIRDLFQSFPFLQFFSRNDFSMFNIITLNPRRCRIRDACGMRE